MGLFNFNSIKDFANVEQLTTGADRELDASRDSYIRNSNRAFSWGQVGRYSIAIMSALVVGAAVTWSVNASAIAIGAAIGVTAVVGITASFVAYKIGMNNQFNMTEVNARQTGKSIAQELSKEKDGPGASQNQQHENTIAEHQQPSTKAEVSDYLFDEKQAEQNRSTHLHDNAAELKHASVTPSLEDKLESAKQEHAQAKDTPTTSISHAAIESMGKAKAESQAHVLH